MAKGDGQSSEFPNERGGLGPSKLDSTRHAIMDVVVVTLCSIVYGAASLLRLPIIYSIIAISIVLVAYLLISIRGRAVSFRELGFRADNIGTSSIYVGLGTLAASIAIVIWGVAINGVKFQLVWLILTATYPAWGITQQLIFQGILHRGLLTLIPNRLHVLLVNATIFSIVHINDGRVLVLTWLAGFFWSWAYQRWANLWVLGMSHGILASLVYPLLLADEPLTRLF